MSTIKVDTIATRTGSGDITASNKIITSSGIDLNGTELILDADADTSITADTDDRIDFKIGGSDRGNIHYDGNDFFSLESNDYLTLVQNQTAERGIILGPTYFKPYNANDNQLDLGIGAARWKDLYLSGGAYIGGTGAANKLDDYEEGTFTPVSGSGSLTGNSGFYTKIGNIVRVGMKFTMPSSSTSSAATISGLPFTCYNDNAARAGIVVSWNSNGQGNAGLDFLVVENTQYGIFYIDGASRTYANLSSNTIYLGGTYPAA